MVAHRFAKVMVPAPIFVPFLIQRISRLIQGRVGAQFWSAYVPCQSQHKDAVQMTLEQIDAIERLVQREQRSLEMARTVEEIRIVHKQGKIASLIGVEGLFI